MDGVCVAGGVSTLFYPMFIIIYNTFFHTMYGAYNTGTIRRKIINHNPYNPIVDSCRNDVLCTKVNKK